MHLWCFRRLQCRRHESALRQGMEVRVRRPAWPGALPLLGPGGAAGARVRLWTTTSRPR